MEAQLALPLGVYVAEVSSDVGGIRVHSETRECCQAPPPKLSKLFA